MKTQLRASDVLTKVDVPEGAVGSAKIERFEITESDVRLALFQDSRARTDPGTYTKLVVGGELWMSDTQAERRDHYEPVRRALELDHSEGRVLITGLGIGMVVQAMLHVPQITHVDVVEMNPDVIDLAAPHYSEMAAKLGKTFDVHHGDAHARKVLFPAGTTWDLAWHDIWLNICTDNLESMGKLARTYTRFVGWQGFWAKEECRYQRDRERRMFWW
jgi:hypothetical protein